MSEHDRHSNGCGDDVAAYVLGALDPAEAAAFRAHLETCAICRDELRAFEPVVDELLALSVPQYAAPGQLRRRIRQAAEAEPQPASAIATRPGSGRRRWMARGPAVAFAAAVACAAAVLVGVQLSSSSNATSRVVHAQVTGRGTAELRVAGDRGELIVRRLPPPPAGHIYEIWLVRGHHAPVPANTLFDVSATGAGTIPIPDNLRGVAQVLVTPERAGGSPTPTHQPVIQAVLRQ